MKKIFKKRWVKVLLIIVVVIFVLLVLVGILFRDDGSLGGFTTKEAEAKYKRIYAEAMKEAALDATGKRAIHF